MIHLNSLESRKKITDVKTYIITFCLIAYFSHATIYFNILFKNPQQGIL